MKLLITIILMIFSSNSLFAAKKLNIKDTIYYLVDTANIPPHDRMVKIGVEGQFKYYTIQCQCLQYDQMPTFYYNYSTSGQDILVEKSIVEKKHLTSLADLIKLCRVNSSEAFNNKYVVIIIERQKNGYVEHKVRLLKPQNRKSTIDTEIIKVDSIKN